MSFPFSTEFINKALSYKKYRADITDTLSKPPVDEAALKMRPYAEANAKHMDDYDASTEITNELKAAVENAPPATWVVITEGWCGDAAFNVPVLAALEKLFPEKIKLKLYLRDSNLELIDSYLTNGGRSIPKVVILNEDLKEVGTWGPRPDPLQTLMAIWKTEGIVLKETIERVREWYKLDDTRTVQHELLELVKSYS